MTNHNPDVLHPTQGSRAHEERQQAQVDAAKSMWGLFKAYGDRPILKKELVDAVAFDLGCSQETAQGYVDALSSIHPLSPFVTHEVNRKPHVSPKDPQLLAEDAGKLASQQDSEQPPKRTRSRQAKGGANAS